MKALPIFLYYLTQEAVREAEEWAKETNQVALVYLETDYAGEGIGYKIGRVQVIEPGQDKRMAKIFAGERFLNNDGAELFPHNVSYKVFPCGSVYDMRMKIGIGPKFST